jgi:hypothetical protein
MRTALVLAVCTVVLALAVGTRAVEAADWNQGQATELATKLNKAVSDLTTEARIERREPMQTASSEGYLLVSDMQQLGRHTRMLERQLRNGQDANETRPLFERIQATVRRIRSLRPRTPLLANSEEEIAEAQGLLEQLTAMYDAVPGTEATAPVSAAPVKE